MGGGVPAERVVAGSFTPGRGYQYYLDGDGHVSRVRRPLADAMLAGWPDRGGVHALAGGARVQLGDRQRARLVVHGLGRVPVPSGTLALHHPVQGGGPCCAQVAVPAGDHRVVVTLAKLGPWWKRRVVPTHLTVLVSEAPECRRQLWCAEDEKEHDLGDYSAVGVDSGLVIAVDS